MRMVRSVLIVAAAAGLLWGCVQFSDKRGVEVSWQADVMEKIEKGKSTRQDVLGLLGPPSQVISLEDETVLYYLYEKAKGQGVILIVYNRFDRNTEYDRAVFFFDANDVLIEYATRINPLDA